MLPGRHDKIWPLNTIHTVTNLVYVCENHIQWTSFVMLILIGRHDKICDVLITVYTITNLNNVSMFRHL